jgi:HrpA-like RNA helicase
MGPTPTGEMLRMPLDSVILMLKEILNEETTPALLDCLEPPDLSTIERSYNSLHKSSFISQPNDSGEITHLGAFASALGIDLTLGALIGLGALPCPCWRASGPKILQIC